MTRHDYVPQVTAVLVEGALANAANDKELSRHDMKQKAQCGAMQCIIPQSGDDWLGNSWERWLRFVVCRFGSLRPKSCRRLDCNPRARDTVSVLTSATDRTDSLCSHFWCSLCCLVLLSLKTALQFYL